MVTNPTIWLVLSVVQIFLSLSTVTVMLAWVFFFRFRAWKKINNFFTGLRWSSEKLDLQLQNAASACGLGQHFQDLCYSFSLHVCGPPSQQITHMYFLKCPKNVSFIDAVNFAEVKDIWYSYDVTEMENWLPSKNFPQILDVDKSCFQCAGSLTKSHRILTS